MKARGEPWPKRCSWVAGTSPGLTGNYADRPTLPEIETTPEMTAAGVREPPPLYSERDDAEDAVVRIYRAMESARQIALAGGGATRATECPPSCSSVGPDHLS